MSKTVLIVDDHPSFRGMARALLESEGFTVVGEAEDGATAIARYRELRPDIVLLDVQLPDTDGFAVATELTSNGSSPDIVLTSSRDALRLRAAHRRVRRARLRPQGRDLRGGNRSTRFDEAGRPALARRRSRRPRSSAGIALRAGPHQRPQLHHRRRQSSSSSSSSAGRSSPPGLSRALGGPENRTGLLLIAVGFAWLLNGLGYANSSFVWTLGYALSALWAAVFVHALLAYPSGLITSSRQRALVVFGYALAASANIAAALFDPDPTSCDDCPTNALLVTDNQTRRRRDPARRPDPRRRLPDLGRGRGHPALARLDARPVAGCSARYCSWAGSASRCSGPASGCRRSPRSRPTSSTGWRRSPSSPSRSCSCGASCAAASRAATSAGCSSTGAALERPRRRRRTCGRRSATRPLELVYWLPDREHYVDVTGQATELPLDSPSRAVTPIAYDDRPVGALIHDPVLRQEAELVDVVVGALRVGIERDRLQAELLAKIDELQSERNFVRDVVNAAPSYFVVTDEEGLLVRFNDTLFAATGVIDDDDARGRPWWELFALPDEAEGSGTGSSRPARRTTPPAYESRMSGSGGELVTGWSLGRVRQAGRLRYLLTGLDLTERVRQERALATSERRSRALLEAIPDAMIRLRRDGTVVDWYADPQHINFAPPGAGSSARLFTTVDSDRAEQIARAASRAWSPASSRRSSTTSTSDGDVLHREGRIVASGEDEVFLIVRDITDRKQAAGCARDERAPEPRAARGRSRQHLSRRAGRPPLPGRPLGTAEQAAGSARIRWSAARCSRSGFRLPSRRATSLAAEQAFATGAVQELGYELDVEGESQYLEARVVPSGDAEYYVVVRDATERKRAQQALETSERRSRALLEGVPDNIYRVAREGHRFLDIRWADPTRLPVPQERFIGGDGARPGLARRPGRSFHRGWPSAPSRPAASRSSSTRSRRQTGRRSTSRRAWCRVATPSTSCIVRDVSDRKRAELVVKAQRDFLSEMGDATPSLLAIVGHDGVMSREPINRSLREFTGLSIADAAKPCSGSSSRRPRMRPRPSASSAR